MKFYKHSSLPASWIIEDDDGVAFLVPAIPFGWHKRRPLVNLTLLKTADEVDGKHILASRLRLDLPAEETPP